MKRNRTRWIVLLLAVLFVSSAVYGETGQAPVFWSDRASFHAKKDRVGNARFFTEGMYHFSPLSKKYGVDPDFVPDASGLDELHISGSAEFSEEQFEHLAEQLRACADGDPVYIVDLRSESHALLNGISVSWYGANNDANRGMTLEEVRKDEEERFGSLPGKTITVYSSLQRGKEKGKTLLVENFMTEEEMVRKEGFEYLRLNAVDHEWPAPDVIDAFFAFTKTIDMDHVWLHFHCLAGRGRTGTFLSIVDMMKNPEVPLGDILVRQAMTGSTYLLYAKQDGSYMSDLHQERAAMIRLMYQYIQENRAAGYEKPWSEWLEEIQEKDAA